MIVFLGFLNQIRDCNSNYESIQSFIFEFKNHLNYNGVDHVCY
jgi:hypothetical protein